MHLHDLSMEYWGPAFLLDIAIGVGEPLGIDERILKKEFGTFTRMLIDIDFSKELPEEILMQRERFEFLIGVEYENCPAFYSQCHAVGMMLIIVGL